MTRQEIAEELKRLLKSRNNDAVKLACLGAEDLRTIGRLNLSGVTEFKRSEKGCFEIKFVDRVKILELLSQLCTSEDDGLDAFLSGLQERDGL